MMDLHKFAKVITEVKTNGEWHYSLGNHFCVDFVLQIDIRFGLKDFQIG